MADTAFAQIAGPPFSSLQRDCIFHTLFSCCRPLLENFTQLSPVIQGFLHRVQSRREGINHGLIVEFCFAPLQDPLQAGLGHGSGVVRPRLALWRLTDVQQSDC